MKKRMSTVTMVRISLLGVMGFILMQFDLRLPIFPSFLALDVSDLPGLIGALVMGPVAGIFISLIKNLLDFITGSNTGGIGQFANFVIGISLIVPIGFVYQRRKNIQGYLIGSAVGIVCMVIVASLMNYFVLLPLFSRLFMPMETILYVASNVNSNVTNVYTLIIFAIVPFNLLKGGLTVALGFVLHKVLVKHLLRGAR